MDFLRRVGTSGADQVSMRPGWGEVKMTRIVHGRVKTRARKSIQGDKNKYINSQARTKRSASLGSDQGVTRKWA